MDTYTGMWYNFSCVVRIVVYALYMDVHIDMHMEMLYDLSYILRIDLHAVYIIFSI